MHNIKALSIFLFLFFFSLLAVYGRQQSGYTVSGKVIAQSSKEPIIGASVTWNNGKEGVVTDVNGEFSFSLPAGKYTLKVSAVGNKTISKKIGVNSNMQIDFSMESDVQQLSEVTVRATRGASNLKSASMGIEKMSIKTIEEMPALMGEVDIMKSMITLPGISSVGEGSGGINVRGGSVGQNLVLLDGAPIYYTSHLFGFFSVFNQDIVEDVTLYKSSIPARYGGRISAVLAVESQNSITDSLSFSGGVGLVSSRLTIKTPIIRDKLGVMVSGRSTYSDWMLNAAKNQQLKNSSAFFYDLNAKIDYLIKDKSKLTISTYHGADKFAFSPDTTYQYGNYSATIKFQQEFNDVLNLTALSTYSNNFSNVLGNFRNQKFDLSLTNENYGGKLYMGAELGKHYVEAGGEFNQYNLNPGKLRPRGQESIVEELLLEDDKGREMAVFAEDHINFDRFKFIIGLRYSHFDKLGPYTSYSYDPSQTKSLESIQDTTYYSSGDIIKSYGGLEPRFSMTYIINDNQSVKMGYQRTRQYMHLIANNVAMVPTDIYKLSNRHIAPQIGDQYTVGYMQNFNDGLYETSLELYYKDVANTVDYKDGASLLLNSTLEKELVRGSSYAYGAEVSVKKTKGKLTGRLSYTYSRAFFHSPSVFEEENINNGDPYPAYYDKPHDITTVLTYKASEKVSYSFNFTYSTGRPVSIPISKFDLEKISVAEFSERNQYRIPDYHRLDVSLNFTPHPEKENGGTWSFGIYNLYSRKNAFSVFFRDQNGAPPQAYRLAILGIPFPSVTYNFNY